ncbi:glycoside hydrolase family 2 protein [Gordonibacter sp. RACS_AR68]|uniref:glycoside hydrolase family 2 protein n=1 Tax=Gordonibacter sp. RACS_AR68 TaxID=2872005 RepID=UPI00261EE623|nr:glycoside hydrolase family 2 TIM barrel-domain containing protein [Gordonibacter sp. RACS_AR68]
MVALVIDPRPDEGKLMLSAAVRGEATLAVRLLDDDREVARGEARAENGRCELALDVPNPHLWSPDDPHLYDLELSFGRDRVKSYCAFRTVGVEPDAQGVPRFCLNHEPLFLRGVLDQGYWPDGLMTAPDDEALAHDVRAMREAGFNLLRKHIKVESDRFYWWCDKLGMLVWQDMVSGGAAPNPWHSSYKPTFFRSSWGRYADDDPRRFPGLAADDPAFRAEWAETCAGTVRHLRNHPCVVAWVLFNEAWGQFDACRAVEAVRALDPTRPIDAVSGWYDQRCGDFLSVHNYFRPLEVYPDAAQPPRAFVISEFGGLSHHVDGHSSLETSYGYGSSGDLASFRGAVRATLAQADALEGEGLAGYVYTQLSDVEEETNGILTYDRRVNKLAEGGAP